MGLLFSYLFTFVIFFDSLVTGPRCPFLPVLFNKGCLFKLSFQEGKLRTLFWRIKKCFLTMTLLVCLF